MKTLLTILTVAFALASCSRSGSTIANDDSAVNSQLQKTSEERLKIPENIPVTEKEVPLEVRTDFYSRYTAAINILWYRLPDGTYKVEFFQGKIKWMAIYKADGTLVHEEHL
jgi:hypothetical protein